MGEEEKKSNGKPTEEKKTEEAKKAEEEKKEDPKAGKPSDDKKEEKKGDDESKENPTPPLPPPPQEIVLRVYMHCEGCARVVRRCLKDFQGVEDVQTDCKTHKVVVKGDKADPLKVLERIRRKSHRQVELLYPIPKPKPVEEPKTVEEKEPPKTEEKKLEPQVITVVLKVHMHCEACAQEIKRRIQRMKGVENAEPDLKSSQVTVKGAFEPDKLVEYVYKRTGKHAAVVKVEPEKKKEGEEEKKEGEDNKEETKAEEEKNKAKEGGGGGGGEEVVAAAAKTADGTGGGAGEGEAIDEAKMEVKKKEFYSYYPQNVQVYPQRFAQEFYAYPPQMFSDENPNACCVM